ncbi:MAG: type II CAAX endopeptidase family protein [Candidatus Latescibacterota bacterium]
MDEKNESNLDLTNLTIFTAVNNYFLLFFGLACVMSSLYLQGLFLYFGLIRIGISVSAAVGIILPVYVITRRFPVGFRRQLHIHPPNIRCAFYVLVSTILTVVIIDFVYILSQELFPVPSEFMESLEILKPDGLVAVIVTFLGLCIIVPIAEELVFRGLVQQVFSRNMNGILAFIMAGVFFGVIHLNAHLLISISIYGIFLGFIFYATQNLSYTILSHAAFNTVSFIQLTATQPEQFTEPPFYVKDIRVIVAAIVLLAFFLRKIKKETPGRSLPD